MTGNKDRLVPSSIFTVEPGLYYPDKGYGIDPVTVERVAKEIAEAHATGVQLAIVVGGGNIFRGVSQAAKGMDPAVLKQRFGGRLCFEGGVSVQTTLPFGTPDDVRAEVEHLIRTLGKDGGYILGPSHAIQAGTPPENVVAMYQVANTYGAAGKGRSAG